MSDGKGRAGDMAGWKTIEEGQFATSSPDGSSSGTCNIRHVCSPHDLHAITIQTDGEKSLPVCMGRCLVIELLFFATLQTLKRNEQAKSRVLEVLKQAAASFPSLPDDDSDIRTLAANVYEAGKT